MLKRLFILITVVTLFGNLFAQNYSTDSLETLLQKHSSTDTFRVNTLNRAAYKYFTSDLNKTLLYATEADSLSEILSYADGKAEAIRLLGIYYEEKSDFFRALDLYERALEIFSESGNRVGMANCFNNHGIIYRVLGDSPRSMEYFQKALSIYTDLGDIKGMANCYNNIGIIFHDQGDLNRALDYYQKSYQVNFDQGDQSGISSSYINIGIVYHDKKDYATALEYYQQSLKISEQLGDVNSIILNCINTGLMYSLMKEYAKASECFNRGLKLSSRVGSKSLDAWNFYGLGSINYDQKRYDEAINFAQRAYTLASEIGEMEVIKESAEIISKASAALGIYKDAYDYQLVYKTISDSLRNEEITRKTISLEFEYKYNREKELTALEQEKKDAIHLEELKHQKNVRNSLIVGIILVVVVLMLLYYNLSQKRKTNRILTEQKNEIIMRNEELLQLNEEIRAQKEHIEKSHEQITESIAYAQLIQNAVLPNHDIVSMLFPEHFILYLPCEVVSGDFYFIKQVKQHTIIAAADCTGHGVPGAFMSMLGIAMLNEIVRHSEIRTSLDVLTELRTQLKRSLQQSGKIGEQPEGMDIAFCAIDLENMELSFAGAHNPCWIFRTNGEDPTKSNLIVLDADRITLCASSVEKPFTEHRFKLQKNDTIYLFTDGYYTQFGGERKEKFQVKRLQSALMQIQGLNLIDQKVALERVFKDWMGDNLQTDDVLVLGFKV